MAFLRFLQPVLADLGFRMLDIGFSFTWSGQIFGRTGDIGFLVGFSEESSVGTGLNIFSCYYQKKEKLTDIGSLAFKGFG